MAEKFVIIPSTLEREAGDFEEDMKEEMITTFCSPET